MITNISEIYNIPGIILSALWTWLHSILPVAWWGSHDYVSLIEMELDTTVVLWSDWLVFCDYGFSVSVLWCPLAIPTLLLGFLLPRTWGISSRLLQQSAATAPYLGRGVFSHGCPSWPWTWSSSSQPSWPRSSRSLEVGLLLLAAVPDLGRVVTLLGRRPWAWRWGSSSQLPPLTMTAAMKLKDAYSLEGKLWPI